MYSTVYVHVQYMYECDEHACAQRKRKKGSQDQAVNCIIKLMLCISQVQ